MTMQAGDTVEFTYDLPSGTSLNVEVTITDPGHPAKIFGRLPEDCEPAEGPEMDITECYVDGDPENVPFDPEGLWFRPFAKIELVSVTDDIMSKAWDKYTDEQW